MNSNMYDTDPYAITTGTTYIRKQFSYPGNLKSTTPPEMFLKEATKEIHCPTTHAHLDWNASMDGLQVVETDFQVQLSSACHYILTIISCTLKAHIVSTLTFMYWPDLCTETTHYVDIYVLTIISCALKQHIMSTFMYWPELCTDIMPTHKH